MKKLRRFLGHADIPKLTSLEREQCDGPIGNAECKRVLSTMNKNKAPGVTGFMVDFFSLFLE